MSIKNLNRLFSSPFYIDGKYAESYIPVLAGIFLGKLDAVASEKPEVQVSTHNISGNLGDNGSGMLVSVISIKNPIIKFDDAYGGPGTRSLWNIIQREAQNPNVAGIVLDIDSGGGQVYGTPEFFDKLRTVEKPLVAYTDGLMCSAAYYIGAACDFIIANKRADAIGSIGAYAQFFDFNGFWEKQGAKIHTLYADQSTEKNKDYREVMEGKYESYIKTSLNPTVDTFIADMKSARPNLNEKVFKGGTWEGSEALSLNLVDSLGELSDAITKVFELSEANKSNNTQNMSTPKSFPSLETVLGLDAPLAANENGSFLNEEQLTAVEAQLSNSAAELQSAQAAQVQAEADLQAERDAHQATVAGQATAVTDVVAGMKAVATLAGVENIADDASAEDIQAALTAQIEVLNGKPGATHTSGAADTDPEKKYGYIDFNSSIYQTK